ncbi:TIGR03085 family metal-binding protein [Streptomyces alkaliterrae]|uniref:TIGR03085 family protein n=1 Tax=Streptomyces alkaliterrae TaxID=2213162 RepID=A0A5P0YLH7_9ACTN|nr:TIGR03085 family metal-binding protein [Streptomyces alkaliterrae]MBB1260071.1 TIGR03085 family protein [Streptomyces alkaliterrae]MQS01224.1 TIGR03085 family protein [Streptomyces alkaliterrae]
MSTHAARERRALADLLEEAGPDAPTLCDGWTTRQLVAHLVVRERRLDAAGGIVIKPLQARLERVQAEFAAKPYQELVEMFRAGPQKLSPFSLKQVDEASNVVEFYLHSEDVRRARPDWKPRELDPVFADALWRRLEAGGRIYGRKSPVGLVLRRTNGQTAVLRKGVPVVTVTGEPGELVLYASGRQQVAQVRAEGDEVAVERAARAPLGL